MFCIASLGLSDFESALKWKQGEFEKVHEKFYHEPTAITASTTHLALLSLLKLQGEGIGFT